MRVLFHCSFRKYLHKLYSYLKYSEMPVLYTHANEYLSNHHGNPLTRMNSLLLIYFVLSNDQILKIINNPFRNSIVKFVYKRLIFTAHFFVNTQCTLMKTKRKSFLRTCNSSGELYSLTMM